MPWNTLCLFFWGRVAHDSISGATDMRIQKLMKAAESAQTSFFCWEMELRRWRGSDLMAYQNTIAHIESAALDETHLFFMFHGCGLLRLRPVLVFVRPRCSACWALMGVVEDLNQVQQQEEIISKSRRRMVLWIRWGVFLSWRFCTP